MSDVSVPSIIFADKIWDTPLFIARASALIFFLMRLHAMVARLAFLVVRVIGVVLLWLLIDRCGYVLFLRFPMDLTLMDQFIEIRAPHSPALLSIWSLFRQVVARIFTKALPSALIRRSTARGTAWITISSCFSPFCARDVVSFWLFSTAYFEATVNQEWESDDWSSYNDHEEDDISRKKSEKTLNALVIKTIQFGFALRVYFAILSLDFPPI